VHAKDILDIPKDNDEAAVSCGCGGKLLGCGGGGSAAVSCGCGGKLLGCGGGGSAAVSCGCGGKV
jgi:hypothetical protein